MSAAFWIRRFLLVFVGAAIIIAGAPLLKRHAVDYSITQGLLSAAITPPVFTVARPPSEKETLEAFTQVELGQS